jgi:hypothetical protein
VKREQVPCPHCGLIVEAINRRYDTHRGSESLYCFMSGMPQPVEGREYADMVERARIVACLAVEVQDHDPHAVWRYLSVVPAEFVMELLQVALAALDVEGKRVSEIWCKWDAS